MKKYILYSILLLFVLFNFNNVLSQSLPLLPGSVISTGNDEQVLKDMLGNNPAGNLLYRRSTHGGSSNTFHSLSDNKGPTVVLIKTREGTVFGGFASQSWGGNTGYISAPQSFLFNLTTEKKANKKSSHPYGMYNYSGYGPTFGGGHDLYISSNMSSGHINIGHTYETFDGASYGSVQAINLLAGPGLTSYYFPAGFITEIEVYQITFIYSNPVIVTNDDVTLQLDQNGQATLTAEEVDNGTSDVDGAVTISIDKTTFDCSSIGGNSTEVPIEFVGTKNQNTYSHGGGYNPHTKEYWYPQWAGSTVYKMDASGQYLGAFNSGQNQMMQIWMDSDSDQDYYTANWNYRTITKRNGSNTTWSYDIGTTAAAVTTDKQYVYALPLYRSHIVVLDKRDGTFIKNIPIPGGMVSWGGMVYANGNIYIAGYAYGWSQYPYDARVIHVFNAEDGAYKGGTRIGADPYNMSFDGETMWFSANNSSMYGYKISEGNAYGSSGVNSVVFTATDPLGNVATKTVGVTVVDNIAPTITLNGDAQITLVEGELFNDPSATAQDNCTTEVKVGGDLVDINTIGEYFVTYQAIDGSGNTSETTLTRKVIVGTSDADPPVLSGVPLDIVAECDAVPALAEVTALDGVDGVVQVTVVEERIDGGCVNEYTITRTFSAVDAAGNTVSSIQTITVRDTTSPVLSGVPLENIVVNTTALDDIGCGISVTFPEISAADNCDAAVTIVYTSGEAVISSGDVFNVGVTTVLVSANDACGNVSQNSFNVEVIDVEAPIITQLENISVSNDLGVCGAIVSWAAPVITDNCNYTFVSSHAIGDAFAVGETVVTYTATDDSGNSSEMSFNVTVIDDEAPIFSTNNITIELDENGVGIIDLSAVYNVENSTDNCGIDDQSLVLDIINVDCSNTETPVTVTLTGKDVHGNVSTATATVTVEDNVAPTIIQLADISIGNDVGVCGAVVSWITPVITDNCNYTFVSSHSIGDFFAVGSTIVTYTATDDSNNESAMSFNVTVTNDIPVISSFNAPAEPVSISSAVSVSSVFVDNNLISAKVDWGDGFSTDATIGDGMINDSHQYGMPGVYVLTLNIEDACGETATEVFHYVVVYDPAGGFVTGGGWVDSPQGASIQYPEATGKASFGFVSKYKKGSTVPIGNTEFKFKAGDLSFKSSVYDWLVVAGANAKFKGNGTINGIGDYGFMITATDGQKTGSSTLDKFRIKIWESSNEQVVYDNELGSADNADATTAITSGSIVVHEVKGKKTSARIVSDITVVEEADLEEDGLQSLNNIDVYPNPFLTIFVVRYNSIPNGKNVKLTMVDLSGKRIYSNSFNPEIQRETQVDLQSIDIGRGIYLLYINDGISIKVHKMMKD